MRPVSDWDCLWQVRDFSLAPLIRFDRRLDRGTPAPGMSGRRFIHCTPDPQTAADGDIAFVAETMAAGEQDGATLAGMWIGPPNRPDQLELRVQTGDRFTGLRTGTLTDISTDPFPARNRLIAFSALFRADGETNSAIGLFLSRGSGNLELVMQNGMPAPGFDDHWKITLFHIFSSFGAGQFLVWTVVSGDDGSFRVGYLVLDERGHIDPIAFQYVTLTEMITGDQINGVLSALAGWEGGFGQRRLVTEGGLMLLPMFGTKINGAWAPNESIYLVQLAGDAGRVTISPDPADPSQLKLAAEVEPGRTYHWEESPSLSGPWTMGPWIWPQEMTLPGPALPTGTAGFHRLVSP